MSIIRLFKKPAGKTDDDDSSIEQNDMSRSSRILLQFKNLVTILKSLMSDEIVFFEILSFLTLLFVFKQTRSL